MAAESGVAERPEDFGGGDSGAVSRWLAEIRAYDKVFEAWKRRCEKIVKRYRDERGSDRNTGVRFNVLWSNIQTLQPTVYAQVPTPHVDRRYKDRDPVGRAAAEILERCLSYTLDAYDFDGAVKAARDDYLLTGRGQMWVRYVPQFGEETQETIPLQFVEPLPEEAQFDEQGMPFMMGEPYRPVLYEEVLCDHVAWENFGHTPAPSWAKVSAVWKREQMTRAQLVERFGEEIAKQVSLSKILVGIDDDTSKNFGDVFQRAEVYEIWDRDAEEVLWISPGYTKGPLDRKPDPLRLHGFFPCPKPLYGTLTTDCLVPVPDYMEYQSQAMELDALSGRIAALTKALKLSGVYPGEYSEQLETLITGPDNRLVPIANWAMFAEKGGTASLISWLPVSQVSEVLLGLIQAREQIKRDLNEITGLSDIVRGQASGGARTATEQRIKGQYASLRLQDRQRDVSRFLRDLLRIKAEIFAEHFEPQSLAQMSGWLQSVEAETLDRLAQQAQMEAQQQAQQAAQEAQQQGQMPPPPPQPPQVPGAQQIFDQAIQLLKDDRLRSFRVDVETDSTVFEDMQAEKEARNEFLTMASGLLTQGTTAIQQMPELGPLFGELLKFGVRGFRAGRQLETAFEATIEQMQQRLSQPQQPSPEEQAAQAEAEARQQEMQFKQQEAQAKLQMEQQRLQMQMQAEQAQMAADQAKMQMERELAEAKMKLEQEIAVAEMNLKRELAQAEMMLKREAAQLEANLRAGELQVEMQFKQQEAEEARTMERDKMQAKQGLDKELGYAKLVASSMPQNIMQFDADGADGLLSAFSDRLGQTDETQLAALSEFFTQQAQVLSEQSARQLALLEQGIKALMDAASAPRTVTVERDGRGRVVGGTSVPARVQ